jgi:hypothetical protein
MSNAALAFLTGMGAGILSGQDKKRQQDRQDLQDQREEDRYQAEKDDRDRQRQLRDAIASASVPATVSNGATVSGISSAPVTYDSADVAGSDLRQANRLSELPAAAQGMPGPTAAAASMVPTPVVRGTAYGDTASAQAAAAAANAPQAVRARLVQAIQQFDPERALRVQAAGLQIEQSEQQAADQAWRRKVSAAMINGGHQGLADLVSNTEHGPAAGVKLKAVPSADNTTVTYNKVGDDGTLTPTGLTFTNDSSGLTRAAAALDQAINPEDRLKMLQTDAKEARESRKTDADIKKAEADAREADARAGLYKAGAEEKGAKPSKLDESDKLALQSINKQRETINTEIVKAQAGGMWDEKSPNAVALRKQLADLGMREQVIVKKYSDDGGTTAADPIGLRGSPSRAAVAAPSSGAGTRVTPAQQASRDKDRVAILQGELVKAQQRLAAGDPRAQTDVTAVANELRRAGVQVSPRPAAATGMSALAAAPTAPSAPAPAANATEAAGQRLDAARTKLQALKASAPGLAKGQAAIAQYRTALAAAQAEVQAAEAQYQNVLGPVAPALMPMKRPMASQWGL